MMSERVEGIKADTKLVAGFADGRSPTLDGRFDLIRVARAIRLALAES